MEDHLLPAPFADPLSQAGSAYQICCDGWIFTFGDIPGDDLAAPDVDHQIEVKPDAPDAGQQIGDVPTPHLIRPRCTQPRYWARIPWWPGLSPPMGLPVCVEHPVDAALGADKQPTIGQHRRDLACRLGRELGFVAVEQDPLALLLAQALRYQALAPFAAI